MPELRKTASSVPSHPPRVGYTKRVTVKPTSKVYLFKTCSPILEPIALNLISPMCSTAATTYSPPSGPIPGSPSRNSLYLVFFTHPESIAAHTSWYETFVGKLAVSLSLSAPGIRQCCVIRTRLPADTRGFPRDGETADWLRSP